MRVIDADELTDIYTIYDDYGDKHTVIDASDITGAPTINAIVIPENPTNGDMIKAIFPDAEITDHFEMGTPIGNIIYVRLCKYQEMRVQQDWWDAPYKGSRS